MTRIYVASLSDYNAGNLHGTWIDDPTDEDTVNEEIATMLRSSKHPNVTVECVECEIGRRGYAAAQGSSENVVYPCDTCNGTGKVPSAEEWAIHDHEGFGDLLGEHASIADVVKHASMIAEHDGAWIAYVGHVGADYADEDGFQDSFLGTYKSAEDFAEEWHTDCGTDLGALASYVDWERVARDMRYDGTYFAPGGDGVYVFTS